MIKKGPSRVLSSYRPALISAYREKTRSLLKQYVRRRSGAIFVAQQAYDVVVKRSCATNMGIMRGFGSMSVQIRIWSSRGS